MTAPSCACAPWCVCPTAVAPTGPRDAGPPPMPSPSAAPSGQSCAPPPATLSSPPWRTPETRRGQGGNHMRVLVTRPLEDVGPLVDALRARGHETMVEPMLAIERRPDVGAPLPLDGVQALVVTSAN